MKRSLYFALSATFLSAISSQSHADYYKLYAPYVEKGEVAAEANWNFSADHRPEQDNYFSQVYALEYGATSWWKTEFGAEVEKENGDSNKLTNIKWENVIAPWKPGENWLDAAFYVEVEKAARDHEPNNAELKLLLEKDFGKIATIANIGAAHQFGPDHQTGWDGTGALRVGYRMNKLFEPGVEYYADLGKLNDMGNYNNQQHLAGPVVYGQYGKIKYDTGVLFGVSKNAPDTTVKLNLEYEF